MTASEMSAHDLAGLKPPPASESLQWHLAMLLADPEFKASARRKQLLRFIVEETLAGRSDRLKGYTIALAVFGREASFDSQNDPVVRLEARRLRRDLDSYYMGKGRGAAVRITIPKGAYVADFEWRVGPLATLAENPDQADQETWKPDVSASFAPPDISETMAPEQPVRSPAFLGWALSGLAGLVGVALVAGIWYQNRGGPGRPPAALLGGPTVLVLPFEALSSSGSDRNLAAGMSQDLITNLLRFPSLTLFAKSPVPGQSSDMDPVTLGHDLGVAYIVRGAVSTDGPELRVGAQLVDTGGGEIIWSETYRRQLATGHLFEVQNELTSGIATTLAQTYGILNEDLASRPSTRAFPSIQNYQCILRAFAYRRTFEDALFEPALACLQAAVKREPDHADAWALLGWLHLDRARFNALPPLQEKAVFDEAFTAATRAIELDRKSVLALQALSSINYYAGRFAEAERLQRQALALNPNDPDTLAQLGWRLAARGDWIEGIVFLERAIARTLSPPGWYFHLIAIHAWLQGDYPAMLAATERAKPDGSSISWALVAIAEGAVGNMTAAREALDQMAEVSPAMARDPAAGFRRHKLQEPAIDALVAGLIKAGFVPAAQ